MKKYLSLIVVLFCVYLAGCDTTEPVQSSNLPSASGANTAATPTTAAAQALSPSATTSASLAAPAGASNTTASATTTTPAASPGASSDSKIFTMAILPVKDSTNHPELTDELNQRLTTAFQSDGRVKILPLDQADYLLQPYLVFIQRLPLTFDANNQPIQFRLKMVVDLDCTDAKTGKILLTTRRLVQLTPGAELPAAGAYDSFNTSSLVQQTDYWILNTLGQPVDNHDAVRWRLEDQLAANAVAFLFQKGNDPTTTVPDFLMPGPH